MLFINFAVGGTKMAIWLTRKRKLKGEGGSRSWGGSYSNLQSRQSLLILN